MDAVGQLAGGIAHDVNNIMTVIQGHGSLLLEQLAGDPRAESVREVVFAADRAANVTRQLLTFSRQQVMQRQALDLNEIVTDLTGMTGPGRGRRSTSGLTLPLAAGDSCRFRHARAGGPQPGHQRPRCDADRGTVLWRTVSARWTKGMPVGWRTRIPGGMLLRVTDTGTGISPQHRPHIFEPFFTTKAPGKGTGLGLATVFGIVKQHRGAISVSVRWAGAPFRAVFPSGAAGRCRTGRTRAQGR